VCEGLRRCKREGKLAEEGITNEPSLFERVGGTLLEGGRRGGEEAVISLCLDFFRLGVMGRVDEWDEQTRKLGKREG
jgi:hypothetical protein